MMILMFYSSGRPPGLLATDLDGTLAVGGIINKTDLAAAESLRARGIPILVITGRNPKSMNKVENLWEVADEILFSSGSGLLTAAQALPTERARLSPGDVASITAIITDAGEDYCVLDPVPANHQFSWKCCRPHQENPDFVSRMNIYAEWARPDIGSPGPASQVLVILPPGIIPDTGLKNALSKWSVFHSSSPIDHESIWLEIFPNGMTKGSALAEWCLMKNIDRERVLALGNDFNDEAMLSWAGMGRVVENAPQALKDRFTVLPPAGQGGFTAAAKEILELLQRIW